MVLAARLAQLITIFLTPVLAKIQWSSSATQAARRLGYTASHTDIYDADCILGGYDPENPSKIYVGGPCSAVTGDMDDPEQSEDFKWIEMETTGIRLVYHGNKEHDFIPYQKAHVHAEDHDDYAQVRVSSKFLFGGDYSYAGFFASTTSYLSKAAFQYTTNTFNWGENETIDFCVVQCCESPPCSCSACSDDYENTAEPGSFKYSILAAAFVPDDVDGSTYERGTRNGMDLVGGNGFDELLWQVVGEDTDGSGYMMFRGNVLVYQAIDFTNMKADNLTITSPEGEDVMYMDMEEDMAYGVENMTIGVGPIGEMTAESSEWSVTYNFPQFYNTGLYRQMEGELLTSADGTKVVEISCVKFSKAKQESMGIHGSHVVFLQYKFDPSPLTALPGIGYVMIYDPTVRGVDNTLPTVVYGFEEESTTTTTTTTVRSYQKVIGRLTLDVDKPEEFVKDPAAREAIAKVLAEQLTDVEEDMISVTLELVDARRLAAGRALQAKQHVLVTYVITMFASDASAAATLGNNIAAAIEAMDSTALMTSLQKAFDDAGLGFTLTEVMIGEVFSQAVDSETETVTFPETPTPTPTAETPTPTPTAEPTPTPTPSPLPESPSSPSTNSSSSGNEDEEEDGSVRPGPAFVMVFGLLALLRTTQA